jgi:hypothetical protein
MKALKTFEKKMRIGDSVYHRDNDVIGAITDIHRQYESRGYPRGNSHGFMYRLKPGEKIPPGHREVPSEVMVRYGVRYDDTLDFEELLLDERVLVVVDPRAVMSRKIDEYTQRLLVQVEYAESSGKPAQDAKHSPDVRRISKKSK